MVPGSRPNGERTSRRQRRVGRFPLITAALVSVAVMVPSAFAVTPSPTIQASYKGGAPDPWTLAAGNCTDPTVDAGSGLRSPHPYGPGTPPLGKGSLKIDLPVQSAGGIGTQFFPNTQMSDISAFDAWIYVPSQGGTRPLLGVVASDDTYDYSVVGQLPVGTNTWMHLDFMTTTLSWTSNATTTGVAGPSGSGTFHDFVLAHPGAIAANAQITSTGCGPYAFYVDGLTMGVSGTATTTDFEPAYPTTFTTLARPRSLLFGQSAVVSSRLDVTIGGTTSPMGSQTVYLYSRPAGSTAPYRASLFANTDPSTGIARFRVTPASSTQYQMRFGADGTDAAPATTVPFTVVTRQKVALISKPATVRYLRLAVIRGSVKPVKAGVTVRLVRLVKSRRVVVATARTGPHGVFTIKAPMKVRGAGTYVVSALPYRGEDLGLSPRFVIKTN